MTFLFDHDVPQHLSYMLLELGHKVTFLRQVLPIQTSDEQLLSYFA